jgi:hypothetical protein
MRVNAPLTGVLVVLTGTALCAADVKANPEDWVPLLLSPTMPPMA